MSDTKYDISETRRDEFDEIMAMTKRAAVFNEREVDTVTDLLEGYEEGPESSGYNFLSCRAAGQIIGYACWGPRDLAGNGYDFYWLCTDPEQQGKGVGRALTQAVEDEIRQRNGVWVVIETSDTDHYASARRLYERSGYTLAMYLKDFYKDGDGLCTYTKQLR